MMERISYKLHSEWIIDDIKCRYKIVYAAISSMKFVEDMMHDLTDVIKVVGASDRGVITELFWQRLYYESISNFIAVGMDWEDE